MSTYKTKKQRKADRIATKERVAMEEAVKIIKNNKEENKMLKVEDAKVGMKVKVIGNEAEHEFKIGDIVEITEINHPSMRVENFSCTRKDGTNWNCSESDVKQV